MIEVLGIIASLCIILAFCFKNITVIRILDCVGAILYIVYGVLIHSFSNIILNSFLVMIQIYHLYNLYNK